MSLKDVQLTKRIAKGAFGSVSKGLYHGETCAVKTLFRVDVYGSKDWLSELTILKNYCSHPNIISYHGAAMVPVDEEGVEVPEEGDSAVAFEEASPNNSDDDDSGSESDAEPVQLFNIYVLSSFAAHGDLRRFWTKSEHLRLDGPNRGGWPLVLKLLEGANNALMYLHDHHVIHRDVKTKNIVVNDRLESELCDFGMARFDINRFVDTAKASPIKALGLGRVGGDGGGGGGNYESTPGSAHGMSPSPERRSALKRQLSVVGTSEFMAPEIIFQEPYDHRCDTYSLGVVIAELMCRRIPCDGGEANEQSSDDEESAEDIFAEYLMESGTAAVPSSGKGKPAQVRQKKESKHDPEPATPRTKQAPFLSRSARSWFKFNEDELVACQGAPAGTYEGALCYYYGSERSRNGCVSCACMYAS